MTDWIKNYPTTNAPQAYGEWKDVSIASYVTPAYIATTRVPVESRTDQSTMTEEISATLSVQLSKRLTEHMFMTLAHTMGMNLNEFIEFLEFLNTEEGLRDKFKTYQVMKKLTGE